MLRGRLSYDQYLQIARGAVIGAVLAVVLYWCGIPKSLFSSTVAMRYLGTGDHYALIAMCVIATVTVFAWIIFRRRTKGRFVFLGALGVFTIYALFAIMKFSIIVPSGTAPAPCKTSDGVRCMCATPAGCQPETPEETIR